MGHLLIDRAVWARLNRRLCAVSVAGLIMLAGCGSSSSSSKEKPSALTPAAAKLYASLTVIPAGGPKGLATDDAKALSHTPEPFGALAADLLSSQGGQLQFKRDLKSWIGKEASVFITSIAVGRLPHNPSSLTALLQSGFKGALSWLGSGAFGSQGAQGAIVMQASDVAGARSFLAHRAQAQRAHPASYRGVSYEVSAGGQAEGIVKDLAVIGSESGIRSVIDTSLGGASIASAPDYRSPPANALASVYLQPESLLKSIDSGSAGSQELSQLGELFPHARSASLWVIPGAGSISVQGEVTPANQKSPLIGREGARALGALPGGAWLAAGVGNTGANLPTALTLLHGAASFGASTVLSSFGGPSIEKLFTALDSPSAKLRQTFGWAGSAGMFLSGSGLFNLQAALVIDSRDPRASREAVGKLARLLKSAGATVGSASIPGTDAAASVRLEGLPLVIFIADGQGKFVLGLGQPSIEGALSSSSTLSTSPTYTAATSTLGEGIEPNLIVGFPSLLGFLEGLGLTDSPGVANLVPYLKALGTLTAGTIDRGGVEHFRAVLGLT